MEDMKSSKIATGGGDLVGVSSTVDEELKEGANGIELAKVDTEVAHDRTPPIRRPTAAIDYKGITISSAAARGDLPHVVLLWGMASAQGCNIMQPDGEGNNPMHYAALAEQPEVASFFMQQTLGMLGPGLPLMRVKNADGETPLLRASATGHIPTINFLLEHGSQLTAVDEGNQNTVFHNAARNGKLWALHVLLSAAQHPSSGIDQQGLIDLLNSPDAEDHTCLDWACFAGHLPVVQYLIQRGMDPRRIDRKGRNSLHLAAHMLREPVVRYLVTKQKMSPYVKAGDGKDAFGFAGGDRAIIAALQASPIKEEDLNLPTRQNPVRPAMMLSYALVGMVIWMLPFFLAWYWYLPMLGFLASSYRRGTILHTARHNPDRPGSKPKMTLAAEWFVAHENCLGFWFGTLLSFIFTYPVASQWPTSTSWSMQAESSLHALTTTPSLGLVISMYAVFAVTIALWYDLVFVRPDPGVLRMEQSQYQEMLEEVAAKGIPPTTNQTCPTCLIRKPLRSKHCRDCGYCLSRMDHHCVWLDNCVGSKNHGRFMAFVAMHLLSVVLFLACIIPYIHIAMKLVLPSPGVHDGAQVLRVLFLRPVFPLLLQALFALATACSLAFLLQEQVLNIFRNMTANERINVKRYAWLMTPEGKFHNRFDRGAWINFLEFSGLQGGKYKRDYSNVYEMPDVSECVPSRKACCGEGGCSSSAVPKPQAAIGPGAVTAAGGQPTTAGEAMAHHQHHEGCDYEHEAHIHGGFETGNHLV